MTRNFELTGPLTLLGSYPTWAQDLVGECHAAKQEVLGHEVFRLMRTATIDPVTTRNFMVAIWPFIERFPSYMAMNLLKTKFGRSQGDNMARRWLVRNIRVEQNHAEYWVDWAEGSGVSREDLFNGAVPAACDVLPKWCEEVSTSDSLAAGMIATNYAVEGVTGEWAHQIYNSEAYQNSLPLVGRKTTLKWLNLHAEYDDKHPWEALEIVCALVGDNPNSITVKHLRECVQRSYMAMRIVGDVCVDSGRLLRKQLGDAASVAA